MNERNKIILRSTILFLILLFPNIYACFMASDLSSLLKTAAYILVVSISLILPLFLLHRRTYFIVLGILCMFCSPAEIACLYLNHNPATYTFMGLFFATTWQEVLGVLSAVWPLAIGHIAIWIAYFFLASRQPNEWVIPRKSGIWVVGIGLPVLFISAIIIFSRYARNINNIKNTGEVILFAKNLTLMKFYKIYPHNIYLNSIQVVKEHRKMRHNQEELALFQFGITRHQDSIPELYILVIGESARYENFALNGYKRSTTPHLSKRSNLVSFRQIYSQAGLTEQSVPHMLSRIPVNGNQEVYTEKTLPEAFQEAGYKTAWITNQSRILQMERVKQAMNQQFETGKDISTDNNYDELLLVPLQNTLNHRADKQFVIIHSMGSHWRYDRRYPSEFEQFKPALGEEFQLSMISPANRQRLVNAYDNTILYTDWFLDSVLTIVEEQHIPAMVVYTPDHGENLYDDERNLVLHGNYSASRWLFHVPFIVWYSDEYANLHPDKIARLVTHADSRDNSSMLFASMLDAAGLFYINDTASNAIIRTRSIFSKDYCAPDTLFVLTAERECIILEE